MAKQRRRIHERDSNRVVIGPRRSAEDYLMAVLVLPVLTVAPLVVLYQIVCDRASPRATIAFMLICVLGFVAIGGMMARGILWALFGWEEISVRDGRLLLAWHILTISRTASYELAAVSSIRVDSHYSIAGGRTFVRRRLAFDHAGAKVFARSQLAADDGELLMTALMRGPLERHLSG
jgi:hypothetical protein